MVEKSCLTTLKCFYDIEGIVFTREDIRVQLVDDIVSLASPILDSLDCVYVHSSKTPHKNSVSMILRALYSHERVLEYN
jgi:hypothetical protein